MDTRIPEYMIAIAEEGTLSQAAEKVHISQSALSQSLARLESELGTLLFTRTGKLMIPTPAGERYLFAAREFVALKEDAYSRIEALSHNTDQRIRIGICNQAYHVLGDTILNKLKNDYPHISINFYSYDSISAVDLLKSGTIDLSIFAHEDFRDSALLYDVLYEEQLVLITPKDYTGGITVRDLQKNEIILPAITTFFYRLLPQELMRRQDRQTTYKTSDTSEMIKMVENGYGMALVPKHMVSEDGSYAVHPFEQDIRYRIYAALRKPRKENTLAENIYRSILELV